MMTATCEVVMNPAADLGDLSADIDALARLQKEIAAVEKIARQLRARVREAMTRGSLDAFVSAGGHRASLFETTRFEADRETALRILSPNLVAEIFTPRTSTTLRVK